PLHHTRSLDLSGGTYSTPSALAPVAGDLVSHRRPSHPPSTHQRRLDAHTTGDQHHARSPLPSSKDSLPTSLAAASASPRFSSSSTATRSPWQHLTASLPMPCPPTALLMPTSLIMR
uniref:Uncharacterized protein n=1 Tax=Triticum urartu TaxID=4572 RepID=A0A8R7Q4T5_TRIUA